MRGCRGCRGFHVWQWSHEEGRCSVGREWENAEKRKEEHEVKIVQRRTREDKKGERMDTQKFMSDPKDSSVFLNCLIFGNTFLHDLNTTSVGG